MEWSNKFPLKSAWRDVERKGFRFFCAGCKRERRIFAPPQVGTAHHAAQVLISTAFFTLIAWPLFSWKGVVAFIPFWAIFEAVYRMRMRDALVCDECGFDPVLFLVDNKKAAKAVEAHWRKRFEQMGLPYPEKKLSGITPNPTSTPVYPEPTEKTSQLKPSA